MINGIFWALMNGIGAILKHIIVFGILGFICLLPFLLKGGWVLGLLIYGFVICSVVSFISEQHQVAQNKYEEQMKRKEKDNGK